MLRPRKRRLLHGHGATLAIAGGCLAALAGVTLLIAPAPVNASLGGDRVHIGSMSLTLLDGGRASATRIFVGSASYALAEPGDGTARAAAAWIEAGRMHVASCSLRRQSPLLIDECTFGIGSAALTSVDVLDVRVGSTWRRTYSDGQQVDISVPPDEAAVPVPFPIGRSG